MNAETDVALDIEGYLVDPEEWNEDIARRMAAAEGLELTDEYWAIIRFMRDYWSEHKVIPDVRHVVAFMTEQFGYDKKMAKKRLFKLFPYGYVKQACKIAGMQRPRAWSTG